MTAQVSSTPPPTSGRPDRRFWLRSALAYALVNLPFLFLTLDTYNVNGDIYSSSYLTLGLNPYHAAVNVGQGFLIIPGAGYFILPYNMVAFLSYPALGFSAIAASAILKTIGLVAGFFAARIAYEIAVRESVQSAKAIFYAVLFNPFLIFVNSIAGDADLLVVFLVFLAVYLFRYGWRDPVHVPAVVLGAVAISLTVLSYYFTLLLVPTLLLYLEGRRKQLSAIVVLAVVLAVLALPILVWGLGSTNPSSLVGTVQVTGYSFPYYLPLSGGDFFGANQLYFTGLAALLAILVPITFRRWKVGEGTTLLTVLVLAFALTFRLPSDVFSILAALVPLSFALSRSATTVTYRKCLLFQAFLVPVYLLVEMFNGPGQVSGVFYWFYPYLHQNTILYNDLGGSRGALALFVVYFGATTATVVALILRDRNGTMRGGPPTPGPTPVRGFGPSPATRKTYIVAVSVAVLLVVLPLAVAYAPSAPSSLSSQGQLNSQEFYAYDAANPLLYPLPGPASFSVDSSRGTLSIPGSASPAGLARYVGGTTNAVNLTVTVSPASNVGAFPVWLSNRTQLVYSSVLMLGPGTLPWTCQFENPQNGTCFGGFSGQTPVINGTSQVETFDGKTVFPYSITPANLTDHEQYFGAMYTGNSSIENTLWAASFGPGRAARCYFDGTTMYLGVETGTNWTVIGTSTNVREGQWFLAGFEVDPVREVVSAFANNATLTLPLSLSTAGNYTFDLGKYNWSSEVDGQRAWIGNLTPVFSLTPSQVRFAPAFYLSTVDPEFPTWVAAENSVRIDYFSSPSGGFFRVNGTGQNFGGTDSLIAFGKLAGTPASLLFQVENTSFVRASSGVDLEWVVLGFGFLLPLWLFVWCSRELWISLRRPSS